MKRGMKLALLCLALLALIGGTLLARRLTAKIDAPLKESAHTLYTLDYDALTELSWTEAGETLTLSRDEDGWHFEGDPALPLSAAKAESLAGALSEITALKTVEKPEALSVYGLEEPSCVITVTAGEEKSFLIGSEESMDGYSYLSDGDGKVYLVDSSLAESFACGRFDLVLKETVPSMTELSALRVFSEVQDYEIDHIEDSGIAYTDDYEWFLRDGDAYLTLDSYQAENLVDKLRLLAWKSCVDYKADEAALSAYGLDAPTVRAEIDYSLETRVATDIIATDGDPVYETVKEEKSFVLEIGDYTDSGACYARLAGSPLVYTIDASVCDALLYMSYEAMRPDDVILLDASELESVTVTLDGESHVFKKDIKTVTDESGERGTETVWLLAEDETAFQDVLYTLNSMVSTELAGGEEPKRSAELSFVFKRGSASHPETELIFYPYDSASCLVTLDGQSTVFVSRYSVTELTEQLRQLLPEADA